MWVANSNDGSVTRIAVAEGARRQTSQRQTIKLGTITLGGIAFDGSSVWVTQGEANTVTRIRASDGEILGTFATGAVPVGIAFDGTHMWITNQLGDTVCRMD